MGKNISRFIHRAALVPVMPEQVFSQLLSKTDTDSTIINRFMQFDC